MGETYYKWLNSDRTTTHRGFKWPKRVGAWTDPITPRLCRSGWHLATLTGVVEHMAVGDLWIAEGRGATAPQDDKVAFESARLVCRVGSLDHPTAVRFAADCAARVLPVFEKAHPGDLRPHKAIQAARRWAKNPTEQNRQVARAAAYASAAYYAADAAAAAAADAAAAAGGAAYSAYAAAAAGGAAYSAYAAAYGAGRAAERLAAERLWQSKHLIHLIEKGSSK